MRPLPPHKGPLNSQGATRILIDIGVGGFSGLGFGLWAGEGRGLFFPLADVRIMLRRECRLRTIVHHNPN